MAACCGETEYQVISKKKLKAKSEQVEESTTMEEKAQVVALSRKRIKTKDESLLPPLPEKENEWTKRKISSRQMNDPLFRAKLESQIESAPGMIEIVDGCIVRCMPESNRKMFISSVFASRYGEWAADKGGVFGVGNGGVTLGNTTRAPDAAYYQPGNIPPSRIMAHLMAQTTAPDMILETEFDCKSGEAESKITNFWLQNGVQEAWLLVIPNPDDDVAAAPVGGPPVPLPGVQMTQVRPDVPYIAIYLAGNNPPLLGYFPIDWHTEFQPPQQSIFVGAPPINCDRFMQLLC